MTAADQKRIIAAVELGRQGLELAQQFHEALRIFRELVKEGGVPRYTVTPGAALNSVIEEVVDPVLATAEKRAPELARLIAEAEGKA